MTDVVTANRLQDGEVVYLTGNNDWSLWIEDAKVAENKEEGQVLLDQARPFVEHCEIVEPYLMKVDATGGRPQAISVRERIRAAGPSMRLDLGKQAAKR
jgi:hypothetical protein